MSDTDLPRPSATRVTLRFHPPEHPDSPDEPVRDDLSACARVGDTLFLACDETAGIERLQRSPDGWTRHRHFDLADLYDLPAGPRGEIDIEGLEVDAGWLWITGSHALKRAKPGDATGAKALELMARVKRDGNRQFLGRLPLADTPDGLAPVLQDGARSAAHVRFTRNGKLRHWLKDDPLLAPFLSIPSKENGLDVEGIAARGLRVWLGLRGPVLRGYGILLEFDFKAKDGQLSPRRLDGAARYRKHLIDTDGQGIRDLAFDGRDILILTGTPLAGDGAARILRWRDAVGSRASGLRRAPEVTRALDLPYNCAEDNPEGLTRWDDHTWLVVHDSPHPARLADEADYHADIWQLTG